MSNQVTPFTSDDRAKIDAIYSAIVGSIDGKPGIYTRLDRLEQRQIHLGALVVPGLIFAANWLKDALLKG
jgi:hypothetical protein